MSTNCYRCEIAAECAALPHGVLDCQDNGARFDAPTLPPCPWTFRGSIDCAQYGPRDCDGVRCAGQTPAADDTHDRDDLIDTLRETIRTLDHAEKILNLEELTAAALACSRQADSLRALVAEMEC